MVKVTIDTQGQPTEVTVDGKQASFGPSAPPTDSAGNTPTAPNGSPPVGAISGPGNIWDNLGDGGAGRKEAMMAANEEASFSFDVRSTGDAGKPVLARELSAQGLPGGWFNRVSWAVYDASGTKVAGQDDYAPSGTLGLTVDTAALKGLKEGRHTFVIAVNGPGNGTRGKLGINFNQQP
jgi:hypothetical protein